MVFCCILTFIQPDNTGSIILPEKLNEFKEYFEVFARTIFEICLEQFEIFRVKASNVLFVA